MCVQQQNVIKFPSKIALFHVVFEVFHPYISINIHYLAIIVINNASLCDTFWVFCGMVCLGEVRT